MISSSLNSGVWVSPVTHLAIVFVHARIADGVSSEVGFNDRTRSRPMSSAFWRDIGSEPMNSMVCLVGSSEFTLARIVSRVALFELLSSPSVNAYIQAVTSWQSRMILSSPMSHASQRGVEP